MLGIARQGRPVGQFRVGRIVAGQDRQGNALGHGRLGDLFHPIRPIGPPAQKPHDDQPRVADHGVDVKIDAHVMGQMHDVGEPQGGCLRIGLKPPRLGIGQGRQFRVGGGQHDDVARRLAQVEGVGSVVDEAGLGGKKMQSGLR